MSLCVYVMLIVLFRLRAMLRAEEQRYLREMEAGEETVLERQAKMRERAKFLKDKREEERLQFVQEKYDQQFRYGKQNYQCFDYVSSALSNIDNLCDLNYRKKTLKLCLFFRNQCEELRSTLSKRQQDEVCVERLEQLRLKEEIEREKKEHEAMYAKLWEQDM